jgi:hypothetical protein
MAQREDIHYHLVKLLIPVREQLTRQIQVIYVLVVTWDWEIEQD